jgi:hypothetical protein
MDGNQRQAQVAYFDEQTVQGTLVGHSHAFGRPDQPGLFRLAHCISHALFCPLLIQE